MSDETTRSVAAAILGQRGGAATSAKYGKEHYAAIGRKGGTVVKEKHGADYYEAIGRVGGNAAHAKFGTEHFKAIGSLGGHANKVKNNPDYRAMGAKGGKRLAQLVRMAKALEAEQAVNDVPVAVTKPA